MTRALAVLTLCIVSCCSPASKGWTQDSVKMVNGMRQPIQILFATRGAAEWSHPPVFLPRNGAAVKVILVAEGDFYLLARDLAGNGCHLHWFDLHGLAKKIPAAELLVTGGYVLKMAEEKRLITVYETRHEIQKKKIREWVRVICPDGRVRYEWIEREVEITVSVLVPVQKVETVKLQVRTLKVELMLNHEGRLVPLNEFLLEGKSKKNEKTLKPTAGT